MSTYNAIRYNNPYTNAGSLVLLSTQTASASSSISFTSGLDSTYSEYLFIFNNMHPATDNVYFEFNLSTDGGSNYNVTKTTTCFTAAHNEAGTDAYLVYNTGQDLAQSTNYQYLRSSVGADADQTASGYLHLFEPSSTTFVKHFIAVTHAAQSANNAVVDYVSGYANTVSACDAINFRMSSGNIDDGTIQMFGVVK